jgi:dUTPase
MKNMMKEDFVTSVNFYTPSPLSKQYRPFPGEEPEVFYSLKNTAKLKPHICPHSNGLDIPLQNDEIFQPLELKKVDLEIKFLLPKNHCALLMNKSSARTKYNVNVQLGLIEVGFNNYVQAVIQNTTNQEIILKKGTAVAQLLLIPATIPTFTYNEFTENSERGSFGSTGQNFEEKSTLKTAPFTVKEAKLLHQHYLDVEDRLGPRQISINFIPIHLLDSPHERAIQVFEFQNFENSLLEKISPSVMETLPVYQCQDSSEETQESKEEPV